MGIGILVIIMGSSEESNRSVTQETNENPVKAVEYEIVQEKNISYLGCRRVGIKITVPDDSKEDDVKQTMENIIEAKKTSWDDITVWAYKNSEKGSAIEMAETMGMKEYSTCH